MREALRKLSVDELLTSTVITLCTEACTIVRTDAGLSEFSIEGWFVSRVCFESTVVSSEARSGLHLLLYADNLVLMGPAIGRHVAKWRVSLLDKGLKLNAEKSKVMVGSSRGKMIVNSGKWPCGVCGKGVKVNSVQCTVGIKWIHKRCSGVRGDLSLVADCFRCKQCDNTIQEADVTEDLVVGGETYGCGKSFCYL